MEDRMGLTSMHDSLQLSYEALPAVIVKKYNDGGITLSKATTSIKISTLIFINNNIIGYCGHTLHNKLNLMSIETHTRQHKS